MKAMLTSYGVQHSLFDGAAQNSLFHRMPPVSFRRISETFVPDYELLLLCDSVIIDETSFDRLVHGAVSEYSHVSETFQALHSEGRIELKDFSAILRPHADLLDRMLDHDLKQLDQWVEPLQESLALWSQFRRVALVPNLYMHLANHRHYTQVESELARMEHRHEHSVMRASVLVEESLKSSRMRRRSEHRHALREVLRSYLAYVNANLILSHQLGVGFHDWFDFTPFYSVKFLSVGREQSPMGECRNELEKLFTIPFPELAIRDTRALMMALNDKRLEDLRRLVSDAVDGRVQFDDAFAKSILSEVFRTSQQVKKLRNIVGYATLPLDLVPWIGSLVQKAIEEGVGTAIEKKYSKRHRWFYMLSDIGAKST